MVASSEFLAARPFDYQTQKRGANVTGFSFTRQVKCDHMETFSRRGFFQFVTLRALNHAQKGVAKAARAFQPLPSSGKGRAQCARCCAPFDPEADELICPSCCENESKHHALLADAFDPKESDGVENAES